MHTHNWEIGKRVCQGRVHHETRKKGPTNPLFELEKVFICFCFLTADIDLFLSRAKFSTTNKNRTTNNKREMAAFTPSRRRLFFHSQRGGVLLLFLVGLSLLFNSPMCLAFSSSSASSHRFHPSEDELSRVHSAKFISCPG